MGISESAKSSWMDVTNESVHTSDDHDIGDIEAISRDFVVVKRGFVNVHYYYIPIGKVEGWDGHVVWLKLTEDEAKRNYERSDPPSPAQFYVKDYPYGEARPYTAAYFPKLPVIPSKSRTPAYPKIGAEETRTNKCFLCGETFRSGDELGSHVRATH